MEYKMNGMPVPPLLLDKVLNLINNTVGIKGIKFTKTHVSIVPTSIESNKLKMNDTDPRIISLGRSYLNTKKISMKQWVYLCDHITSTFRTWGITTSKDSEIIKQLQQLKPSPEIY